MHQAVIVIPFVFETSLRFLHAALALSDVRVGLISQDPLERFGDRARAGVAAHWQVRDALDPAQLSEAIAGLAQRMGPIGQVFGVLEHLQVPLAQAREALGLPGMSSVTARNFRDKARMKELLRAAGVPCARHGLATDIRQARALVEELGLPLVIKPPAGAGGVGTFRVDEHGQVDAVLGACEPCPDRPLLFEEFITGEEYSFDSVCVDGALQWHSIAEYQPTPLEVLRNAWIQWTVLLPRDIAGPRFERIPSIGAAALQALGMRTGLSHMEWFRRPDGSVAVSEVGARPPGAQITSLLGWVHDTDMHASWARLMISGSFEPLERRYAAGAAYLRGQGSGRVAAVHGLEEAQRELGALVVETSLPRRGQSKSSSYEGEGYVILRHRETEVVAQALRRLVRLVRVELR